MSLNRRDAILLPLAITSLGGFASGPSTGGTEDTSEAGNGNPAGTSPGRRLQVPTIQALRALLEAGVPTEIYVNNWRVGSDHGGGHFRLATSDKLSPDNGGTVIVDALGRRWKRLLAVPETITAEMFGATGDGAADDTDALQAALDCAVETGLKLALGPRLYRTTRPLHVGKTDGPVRSGIAIEGTSRGSLGPHGTSILLDSEVAQDAVLTWRKTAWRNGRLSHVGLASTRIDGARYGLLLESSEISDINFSDLDIENVQTAIALLEGTGKNGEFCSFRNIWTMNVETFFFSNAGQAYGIDIDHAFCYHRGGGTLIDLAPDIVGGGLSMRAFNASPADIGRQHATVSNTTLLRLREKHNSPIVFEGGRIEHITRILDTSGQTQDGIVNTPIKFMGTQFTTDNVQGSPENTTNDSIRLTGTSPNLISFEQCQFTGCGSDNTLFHVKATGPLRGSLIFDMCDFNGFARLPSVTMDMNALQDVTFRNCIGNPSYTAGSTYSIGLPYRFSRKFGPGGAARQSIIPEQESGHTTSRPQNLLAVAQFRRAASKEMEVACDDPWRHSGERKTLLAFDDCTAAANGRAPANTSPYARSITFHPRSGIFQDIGQLNLRTPNLTIGGAKFCFVKYEAMIEAGSENGGHLRFSLENSDTNQIYDEVSYDGFGASSTRQLVKLIACAPVTTTGNLRLAIVNEGNRPAMLTLAYQFVATEADASFSPMSADNAQGGARWSVNLESGRFFSRLSLPQKPDRYGSAADLIDAEAEGDIYLSSDTRRLTYAANGIWWTLQRSISGMAPPDSGKWVRGDLCYNAKPEPGGYIGWVCIEEGAPGTWRPFGKIE